MIITTKVYLSFFFFQFDYTTTSNILLWKHMFLEPQGLGIGVLGVGYNKKYSTVSGAEYIRCGCIRVMKVNCAVISSLFLALSSQSLATKVGIDDDYYYVDHSFSCPLQTDPTLVNCEQVCVEVDTLCPTELQCTSGTLCADGSCQATCPSGLTNPCTTFGTYDTACFMGGYTATAAECESQFKSEYAAMDYADGDDVDDDYYGEIVASDYPGFIFFYCWMAGITLLAFLYFAYNNKISPVGEVKPFIPEGSYCMLSA
jgi:hypothetical protein